MHEPCPFHEDLSRRIDNTEQDIKKLYGQNNSFSISQGKIEVKLEYITKIIEELTVKVNQLVEQPSKRWNHIVTFAIATGAACIVTAILEKVIK